MALTRQRHTRGEVRVSISGKETESAKDCSKVQVGGKKRKANEIDQEILKVRTASKHTCTVFVYSPVLQNSNS